MSSGYTTKMSSSSSNFRYLHISMLHTLSGECMAMRTTKLANRVNPRPTYSIPVRRHRLHNAPIPQTQYALVVVRLDYSYIHTYLPLILCWTKYMCITFSVRMGFYGEERTRYEHVKGGFVIRSTNVCTYANLAGHQMNLRQKSLAYPFFWGFEA